MRESATYEAPAIPADKGGGSSASTVSRPPIRRIASCVLACSSNLNHAPPAPCCALCKSSGQRYVVFFRGSSAQMEDAAQTVFVGAASSEFGEPAADIAAVLTVPPRSEQSRERERDNYWRFDLGAAILKSYFSAVRSCADRQQKASCRKRVPHRDGIATDKETMMSIWKVTVTIGGAGIDGMVRYGRPI